ncbi:MAG TPA: ABC transporter ATP-binding protein [Pseudorhodoplanes sp.]|nr:ABC transporter ATP-binding protein [Pseudorhodoplanes sp.]HVZ13768.1 ABC transporter ATP-binding protein [Bauldia sp.]
MAAALEVRDLSVVYGAAIDALRGASLVVDEGGFVVLLGSNGAGKSTLLKAASGLLASQNGRATGGQVLFFGDDIRDLRPHHLARRGLLHVREGRHVFANMTVVENLEAATFSLIGRQPLPKRGAFDEVYSYFPVLAERRHSYAGLLSGGEQQMLAIGRALVAAPRLLLVDEASLGLAPLVSRGIFEILKRINREKKLAILAVEQNVALALRFADRAYVLENGQMATSGSAADLSDRDALSRHYLGGSRALVASG